MKSSDIFKVILLAFVFIQVTFISISNSWYYKTYTDNTREKTTAELEEFIARYHNTLLSNLLVGNHDILAQFVAGMAEGRRLHVQVTGDHTFYESGMTLSDQDVVSVTKNIQVGEDILGTITVKKEIEQSILGIRHLVMIFSVIQLLITAFLVTVFYHFFIRSIVNPLRKALQPEPELEELAPTFSPFVPLEIRNIVCAHNEYLEEREERTKREEHYKLATQVAHDIRSPLTYIRSVVTQMNGVPPQQQNLLNKALLRLDGIANDLLKHNQAATQGAVAPVQSKTYLAALIREIVTEKRHSAHLYGSIKLETIISKEAEFAEVNVSHQELARVLSNLLNNALESLVNNRGIILVRLFLKQDIAVIKIEDNGCGIPKQTLAKLGREMVSSGKVVGNGMGVMHAVEVLGNHGGSVEFASKLTEGTCVTLRIPTQSSGIRRLSMIKKLDAQVGALDLVLIDDDILVRKHWEAQAAEKGMSIRTFPSYSEFLVAKDVIDKSCSIYVDQELGDGNKGNEIAKKLKQMGFELVHLTTGHEPAQFEHDESLYSVQSKEFPL